MTLQNNSRARAGKLRIIYQSPTMEGVIAGLQLGMQPKSEELGDSKEDEEDEKVGALHDRASGKSFGLVALKTPAPEMCLASEGALWKVEKGDVTIGINGGASKTGLSGPAANHGAHH